MRTADGEVPTCRGKGYRDRSHVATDERLQTDIDAAGAELAASKFIGRRWTMSIREVSRNPISSRTLRFTRHQGGGLIVREQDTVDRATSRQVVYDAERSILA